MYKFIFVLVLILCIGNSCERRSRRQGPKNMVMTEKLIYELENARTATEALNILHMKDMGHQEKPSVALFSNGSLTHTYHSSPRKAICEPQSKAVEVEAEFDFHEHSRLVIPQFVDVKVCNNACLGNRECNPTIKEKKTLQIIEVSTTKFDKKWNLRYRMHNISFVEDKSCECQCKTKKEDCDVTLMEYDPMDCACKCKSSLELTKRSCKRNRIKYWTENKCKCFCRHEYRCSYGLYYDHNKCSCEHKEKYFPLAASSSEEENSFEDNFIE